MALNHLLFDASDDPQGQGSWDAAAVEAAVGKVQDEGERTTVTLTFTGPWEWGEALVARLQAQV